MHLPAAVRDDIEKLVKDAERRNKLTIILDTGGGSIDSVERTVGIIRRRYDQVDFIIPDQAMSAGTVFALSGDNILYGLLFPTGTNRSAVQN